MPAKRKASAAPVEPAKKRTRTDVAARTLENQHKKFKDIRVKLNGILTPLGEKLHWEDCITQCTKAWWHAHRLANEVVAEVCARGQAVLKLDQGFFYSCLAAVDKNWEGKNWGASPTAAQRTFTEVAEQHRAICSSTEEGLPDLFLLVGFKRNASQLMATNAEV